MAAVNATVRDFKVLDNSPLIAGLTTTRRILLMFAIDNGATQVAGGTDTLDLAVSTVAESRMRGGLTLTPRSWLIVQPVLGASVEYAGTITNSSGTLQITPKLASDWSTNATIAANGATNAPYVLHVLCDVA